ncbi:toxin-antitoxin system, antitoxin component, Xre domain protein [Gemella bergeri ATCC 700627]|uniref:Toxin-antitoxin system, antitoxin component, Xre domain protein n=1 Tax=Gemella bergeri ATCC 700627 TaxID=1321820 RepID=U2RVV7_9BACL|nr:helix-turn-helix transcriptional regulator [Gemella bergeri]ERK57703.1 toxin-antitoxin system, antitoxin component, Xre domain protein [Gemella bergeri ATCC 700627]
MASNIQYYMEKRGMNAKGFATELDFKYTTVLDWLNTKTYPRIDKIEIMANFFGIEKSDLVEEKTKPNPKGIKIPVLGIVPAGVPIEAVEDILDYEEIPQSWANQGEFF